MITDITIVVLVYAGFIAAAAWMVRSSTRRCQQRAKERAKAAIKRQWTEEERNTYEWLKSLNKREKR